MLKLHRNLQGGRASVDHEPVERSRPGADAYMVSGTVFDPRRPERL